MLCANCGKEIKDNAKFCPECDIKIVPAEEVKEEPKVEEPKVEEAKTSDEPIDVEAEAVAAEESPKGSDEPIDVEAEAVEESPKSEEAATSEESPKSEEAATSEESPGSEEKSTSDTVKEKIDEAVEDAKKAGKEFAESDMVQNAKKEMNDILEEAKSASQRQAGTAGAEETVQPRESVSFLVDWFYWTGRRSRMSYLLVGIVTSVCSLALGATGILSLLFCYISAVNLVKRLHDFDKPGWYAFLLMFAEYVIINLTWIFGLLGAGLAAAGITSGLIMWLIPLLIVWGIKLWVFFVPGTKGPNRFGPEPK